MYLSSPAFPTIGKRVSGRRRHPPITVSDTARALLLQAAGGDSTPSLMSAPPSPPLPFFGAPVRQAASSVPPLTEMALNVLADNCADIPNLQGIPEELLVSLLGKIMQRGRLDYRMALVFIDSGHEDIADAMKSLDLFAAVPSHNAINYRGGGCR